MRTISYSSVRKDLAGAIERANADREPALIIRKDGKPAAVLMSLEDFAS
jgi:antitoxin YefM